jgi:hypothetical protein
MPEPFYRLVNQGMILGEPDPETGKAEGAAQGLIDLAGQGALALGPRM